MRILHFSDLHVGLGLRAVPWLDWAGKRLAGGTNLLRGRGKQFEDGAAKIEGLAEFQARCPSDLVICSGDLTALGTQGEFEAAHRLLSPLFASSEVLAIPGNHDLYTPSTVRQGRFERWFSNGLDSDLPDLKTDGDWPVVRLLADHSAAIAVNSARPTRAPWRSSGRIPKAQVRGLEAALEDPRVAGRFVFVVTHYAPFRPDGSPDAASHGLRNVDELLAAMAPLRRGAILCGHIHTAFRLPLAGLDGEVFCAGSATMHGRERLWVFERRADGWIARLGRWIDGAWQIEAEGDPVSGLVEAP